MNPVSPARQHGNREASKRARDKDQPASHRLTLLSSEIVTAVSPSQEYNTGIPVSDTKLFLSNVALDGGEVLPEVEVHYRLEGKLSANADNVVLVIHALTGNANASSWWKNVIGPDKVIDPARHAVLCISLLGGCDGTTGPCNANPFALPPITTRDQARVLALTLDALGIKAPLLVCGGSLGGMVTLEFAASYPARIRSAAVFAAPAVQTTQGLAWNAIMRRAIALGGEHDGLALARMIGMLSYRTPDSLEQRFGRKRDTGGGFQINEWLDLHGERLVKRFNAASYGALIDAMDEHDVGRGRGGVAEALKPVADRIIGAGIKGDLLYPAECVEHWTDIAGASYADLSSTHGHDAFLLEGEAVSAILEQALRKANVEEPASGGGASVRDPAVRLVPPGALGGKSSRSSHKDKGGKEGRTSSQARPLRVVLAGCGHVGGSLLELLSDRHEKQAVGNVPGPQIHVQHVLVRDTERERRGLLRAISSGLAKPGVCTGDAESILDGDVDVLVEAIGGTEVAGRLVETALARGIRVVTANKALLGLRGEAVQQLASHNNTRIDFEGAVCGAIPIVRCVRSGAAGVGISRITGILNGTSNFLLELVAAGHSFHDAVKTAQELGYAEADPSRDLNGQDSEDKLRVLAWLAFGIEPADLAVTRRGIDRAVAEWASEVAASGDRVKLLATVERIGEQVTARILPTRVSSSDSWAAVTGAFNRVVIESESAGRLEFHGPGAGGLATAGAVLADLLGH